MLELIIPIGIFTWAVGAGVVNGFGGPIDWDDGAEVTAIVIWPIWVPLYLPYVLGARLGRAINKAVVKRRKQQLLDARVVKGAKDV